MSTASEVLARFCAALETDGVEPALVSKAKDHLLDTIGVACAGIDVPEARAVGAVVAGWGGTPEAGVIGTRVRLPAPKAAFVNALHARIHTFDDTHDAGPSHPGSAIVAAALSGVARAGASGRTLLAALLAGYEVATRVSAALGSSHYEAGFHSTGTSAPLGAAAAAARAHGLDASQITRALGLAGEGAIGLRQYQDDGSMLDSALNGARGAELGVTAAALAAQGVGGPLGVLDGRYGMLRVMQGGSASILTDDLGRRWEFADTQLKPFASCRFTHGPIAALRAAKLDAQRVDSVEIATFRASVDVSDRPDPRDRLGAILSHQLSAALALLERPIMPRELQTPDPVVRDLAQRVRVRHDPALDAAYPAHWPHRIAVTMKTGEVIRLASDAPPPIDREALVAKFRALASPRFGSAGADAIIASIDGLEGLVDLEPLLQRLQTEAA
jgi:2-methylcitrate dehydratase PrpD